MDTKERIFQKVKELGNPLDREAFDFIYDAAQQDMLNGCPYPLILTLQTKHVGVQHSSKMARRV